MEVSSSTCNPDRIPRNPGVETRGYGKKADFGLSTLVFGYGTPPKAG